MAVILRRGRALLALLPVVAACAKVAPPPGGPADTTAPIILAVEPDSQATRVPVNSVLRIRFSESVDAKTLEQALWVTPGGAAKPRIDMDGAEASIRMSRPLPDSSTVSVLLTTVLTDRLPSGTRNRLARPARWIFSTGDSLWPGRVSGKLEPVGFTPGSGVVLVALYDAQGDSVPDPRVADPVAVTEPDSTGRFELIGLPADGVLRWLIPLYDRDGNRILSGAGEFAGADPESVVLSPARPDLSVEVRLVDPKAPATLSGSLAKSVADTVAVWVELVAAAGDSAAAPVKRGRAGKAGLWSLTAVPAGDYRLLAFCDLDADGVRDPEETVIWYGDVRLTPGAKRELGTWTLPGCLP